MLAYPKSHVRRSPFQVTITCCVCPEPVFQSTIGRSKCGGGTVRGFCELPLRTLGCRSTRAGCRRRRSPESIRLGSRDRRVRTQRGRRRSSLHQRCDSPPCRGGWCHRARLSEHTSVWGVRGGGAL